MSQPKDCQLIEKAGGEAIEAALASGYYFWNVEEDCLAHTRAYRPGWEYSAAAGGLVPVTSEALAKHVASLEDQPDPWDEAIEENKIRSKE